MKADEFRAQYRYLITDYIKNSKNPFKAAVIAYKETIGCTALLVHFTLDHLKDPTEKKISNLKKIIVRQLENALNFK